MNYRDQINQFFNHTDPSEKKTTPIFLPDLTIWYNFHLNNNSLPNEFKGQDLETICTSLKIPIWNTSKPWRIENSEVEVSKDVNNEEIIKTYQYQNRVLTAKWIKGPDGDWWQTEYPVKEVEDLDMIKTYLKGRSFHIELDEILKMKQKTNGNGIVVPLLPTRAFSWLMLEILGWTDGLMILLDEEEIIKEIVEICELQIQDFCKQLIKSLNDHGFQIFLSPDNLDGMFVSPEHFDEYLKSGYENTSKICHDNNSKLMVHGGGPLLRIIERIANSGVDCISGISGPPQGNTPIDSIREKVRNEIIFLGIIPQDYLMDSTDDEVFTTRIKELINICKIDKNSILGIADHVPLEADISRLKKIAALVYSD